MKKNQYAKTQLACYLGFVTQAICANFVPLLFLTFQSQYGIPLSQVTLLITINFGLQLLIDTASAFFIDKIGYRRAAVLAHVSAALGLVFLAILPEALPSLLVGAAIALTTILGYTPLATLVGGGGLGAVAVQYGLYRFKYGIMYVASILLIILVEFLQESGMKLAKKADKRIR